MKKMLEDFFSRARGRRIVAEEFLKIGAKIDNKGKIYAGRIELPPAKIARALGVDRRVVIETAKEIANDDDLLQIFHKLEPRAFIGNAAKYLGFDSLVVRANNPKAKGIVASITAILDRQGIAMRQIICDDPELFPEPVLTIVIDGRLDGKTISLLKKARHAESIEIR